MRRTMVGVVAIVAAAAGAAAGGVGGSAAERARPAQVDLASDRLVDLSHPFNRRTLYWPTAKRFTLTKVAEGETEGGYFYAANNFAAAEHGGTHLDAPVHFSRGGDTADEIPLRRLAGPAVNVDVRARASADRDHLVSSPTSRPGSATTAASRAARSCSCAPAGARAGRTRAAISAPRSAVTAAVPKLHFPGLAEAAARWLVAERQVKAVGIDTASIDRGQSTAFEAHRVLGAAQVPVFENVAGLERLPAENFQVIALPMKIAGGSGGPLRAVAIVDR